MGKRQYLKVATVRCLQTTKKNLPKAMKLTAANTHKKLSAKPQKINSFNSEKTKERAGGENSSSFFILVKCH